MTELNFGEGVEISRNLATDHSLVFGQCLGTIIGSALYFGVSFSLLTEHQDLIKVYLSAILDPLDSNLFMLCLGLCHSFPHITTVAFNITVILVYAPTVMLKKLKLNGSMKTYKTC